MRIALIGKLAVRNLIRQRRRSALALVILAAGTTAVLLTRAWQVGMLDMIARDGAGTWVGGAQVMPRESRPSLGAFGLAPNIEVTDALTAKLGATPHVVGVTPRIRFLGKVFKGEESTPFVGMAMDFRALAPVLPGLFRPERIVGGRAPTPGGNEVLVSESLASILGVHAGDTVTLLARPIDGGLEGIDVQVAGILSGAFEEELRRTVVLELQLAQQLLRMEGRATQLLVGVAPMSEAGAVARALADALADHGLTALPYDEVKPRWKDARALWSMSLRIVFVIVLVVAVLGLYTTIQLMVAERRREVGTLMAIGVSRRWTVTILIAEGAMLGAAGGLIGAGAAVAIVTALSSGVAFNVPGAGSYLVFPTLTLNDLVIAVAVASTVITLTMLRSSFSLARRPPTILLT